jgi:proliferating cell nuclear antigen
MSKNVVTIKTVQIAPFRTLMAALKDILLETTIYFKKTGIKMVTMDKSHTVLAYLFLRAENFEEYNITKDNIPIGVNIYNLYKLINSIDNDDTFTIFIEEQDYNDGIVKYLGLMFENGNIKQTKIQKLKLYEPEAKERGVPDVTYPAIINMPSSDFQKIVRDLSCISEKIEIKSVANELIFRCEGTFANAEVRRVESENGLEYKGSSNQIIQGVFSLKNLNYFIKCTNLCNQIEMYLGNDLPIIVKYNVASLGEIQLGLTPLPQEDEL